MTATCVAALVLARAIESHAGAIEWRAPSACPDASAVAQRVDALVGAPIDGAGVVVDVTQQHDGYTAALTIVVDEQPRTRSLHAADCETLAAATAVVIAVSLEPVRVRDEAQALARAVVVPPAATVPPSRPPAEALDRGRADRIAEPAPRRRVAIEPRASIGYGTGVARGGSGLVDIALGVGRGLWRVELGARWWWPRRVLDDGRGARLTAATLAPAACLRPAIGRVAFAVCPGLELGVVWASGIGWRPSSVQRFPWVAPRVQARVHVAVSRRVELFVAGEGAAAVVRPGVAVTRDAALQTIWQSPPASVRVLGGVALRFDVPR